MLFLRIKGPLCCQQMVRLLECFDGQVIISAAFLVSSVSLGYLLLFAFLVKMKMEPVTLASAGLLSQKTLGALIGGASWHLTRSWQIWKLRLSGLALWRTCISVFPKVLFFLLTPVLVSTLTSAT